MVGQINVEYEILPAIVDPESVLESAPSLLHEGWPNNLCIERVFEGGKVDEARQAAEIVIERRYRMRQAGVPCRWKAVPCWLYRDQRLDELGRLTDSTQVPHIIPPRPG